MTRIWDYLRYDLLSERVFAAGTLPPAWFDQRVLYYAWFASIGFTRFENVSFDVFLHDGLDLTSEQVSISVSEEPTRLGYPAEHSRLAGVLPRCDTSAYSPLEDLPPLRPHFSLSTSCDPSACGMLLAREDDCYCFRNGNSLTAPFFDIESLLYSFKLPGRAVKYKRLKQVLASARSPHADVRSVPAFSKEHRIVRWAWYGDV